MIQSELVCLRFRYEMDQRVNAVTRVDASMVKKVASFYLFKLIDSLHFYILTTLRMSGRSVGCSKCERSS